MCAGPSSIDQNLSGSPAPVQLSSTGFQEFQFPFTTYYSSAFTELDLSAIPATNGGANGVQITQVVILETLVPPVFTLSPSAVPITCGQPVSQTFTVNNTTYTPNVSSFSWNLGSTPTGWKYLGNPAASTIVTSTPSLTLTSACALSSNNINVSVTAQGGTYNTNSAAVSITQPSMAITGLDVFCSGSQNYSIINLPCSATVTWASSNTNVATVATANNVATLTKVANGSVRLTATINSVCQNTSRFKDIAIGAPTAPTVTYAKDPGSPTLYIFTATSSGPAIGFDWYVNGVKTRSNADAVTYLDIPCGTSKTVKCTQANSCGTSAFSNNAFVLNGCSFSVSPNPAESTVTIEEMKSNSASVISANSVTAVSLYDLSGNFKKKWSFSKPTKKTQIDVSQFSFGTYILEITSNGKKARQQLIIK